VRLLELVEGIREGRRLVRACDDEDLVVTQRFDNLTESCVRRSELEVLVLSALPAQEEIDRPTRRDVPGRLDTCEQA
jgi:hypothetical protein